MSQLVHTSLYRIHLIQIFVATLIFCSRFLFEILAGRFVFHDGLGCSLLVFEIVFEFQIHFIFFATRRILNFNFSFSDIGCCCLHTFCSLVQHFLFRFHNFVKCFLLIIFKNPNSENLLIFEMLANLKNNFSNILNFTYPLNI